MSLEGRGGSLTRQVLKAHTFTSLVADPGHARRAASLARGVSGGDNAPPAHPAPSKAMPHMRTFVLRARAAPTDSQKLLAAVGKEAHSEILAHTLMNAIFVAQSHRPDVTVYLVLESTPDFSRTIRFEASAMHDIGGFDERSLLGKVAVALDASRGMGKEDTRPVESGVTVRTLSFEKLVQELATDHQLYVMDRKGTPMREQMFEGNPCFLLTDHIPMPKNTFHTLDRLGAKKITLGSKMLFASQCVVLIHHALDER